MMRPSRIVWSRSLCSRMSQPYLCPRRLAIAILKCNATCGVQHEVDNVGTLIGKKHIKELSTTYKDNAIHAEGVIHRTRAALDVHKRDNIVEIGDYEVEILLATLEIHPDKKSIDDVAREFAGTIIPSAASATSECLLNIRDSRFEHNC